MKNIRSNRSVQAAFTLVEVMVCVALGSVAFLSLYLGFSGGFGILQSARESLRATQIMVEKMETIRLYNWDQITNTNFIPEKFQEFYNPFNTNATLVFNGELIIAPVSGGLANLSYANDLRMVTVRLNWKSGAIQRQREMSTLVTRDGLQPYVY